MRHGATEWSAAGRHTGRTDIALTADGQRQAAALCPRLARGQFALALTSPLLRARETARIAGFADATVDADMVEWDYGEYEGMTSLEIQERAPGWTIWSGNPPGGETAAQVGARAERVLARCARIEGRVLLVAHGHFLRVLTAVCLGFAPVDGARFALAPAGVGILGYEHDYRTLRCWDPDSG